MPTIIYSYSLRPVSMLVFTLSEMTNPKSEMYLETELTVN